MWDEEKRGKLLFKFGTKIVSILLDSEENVLVCELNGVITSLNIQNSSIK
jgi:hypothetical protein